MNLLYNRSKSLTQRANVLIGEFDGWLKYAESDGKLEKNVSQLDAIQLFMEQLFSHIQALQVRLNPTANLDEQLQVFSMLETGIYRTNFIWDYFRSKLEQRFNPLYGRALLVSDLVAYDCYEHIRQRADALGIQHALGLRDYPLTFLQERYSSPVTWMRHAPLVELDQLRLPLPMIGIPHDQLRNPWELLSIHHEVAHDIDADFGRPSRELGLKVFEMLIKKGRLSTQATTWHRWMSEIFADFMAIMLGGAPFLAFLAVFTTLPKNMAYELKNIDPHPAHYLRALLDSRFALHQEQSTSGQEYVRAVAATWRSLYTSPPSALRALVDDFDLVIDTFLTTPLECLADQTKKPHSLEELVPPAETFDQQASNASLFLAGHSSGVGGPIRQIVSASQLAFSHAGEIPGSDLANLAELVTQAVIAAAPPGKLGLRSMKSTGYIHSLADRFWNQVDPEFE